MDLSEGEIIEISHCAVIPMEFYTNFCGIPKIMYACMYVCDSGSQGMTHRGK
jgi:hypothetical protein